MAFLHPELARTAAVVRARWRAHGLKPALAAVPKLLGPARIALSAGTGPASVTLYLYDTAGVASRALGVVRRHRPGEATTAGFCLYVGARRVSAPRFVRLFDIAEARPS